MAGTRRALVERMRALDAEGVNCRGFFVLQGVVTPDAKRITKAIARILNASETSFAVLGQEESCTGDPAKRAGNEFLYQMQAAQNIATLNGYGIKRIITGCPHCFNVLKNEYPELGGNYEVLHHTNSFENSLKMENYAWQMERPSKASASLSTTLAISAEAMVST